MHVKVMCWTNLDGQTNGRMHALMHAHTPNHHCDNYVKLTASGLDKNEVEQKNNIYIKCLRLLSVKKTWYLNALTLYWTCLTQQDL
jgi:hypothetical protein